MKFFNRTICWVAAILFFAAPFTLAQSTPAQSPSARSEKLDIETINTMEVDKRRELLSALSAREREEFAEQFYKLPPGGPSNGKINALFMTWAAVDPAKAVENAKKFSTPDTRRAALEAVCFGVKPEGGETITQSIRQVPEKALPPGDKERFLGMAIAKWSQANPETAARFMAEIFPNAVTRLANPGAGDGDLLTTTRAVGENWGAAAPHAALDWYKKQSPENVIAVQSAVLGWWRKDPKAAMGYLKAHVTTPNEREVAGLMSGPIAQQDPSLAAQWVEWVKEEKLRRRLRSGIAQIWAVRDPKAAAAWAKTLVGKEGEGAIGLVAGVWGYNDPAAAHKWFDSLHGRARDLAIRGYAPILGRKNPKSALEWALKIEDHNARTRLAKAIAADWLEKNPEETKAWIKKSKLSESDKKELLDKTIDVD